MADRRVARPDPRRGMVADVRAAPSPETSPLTATSPRPVVARVLAVAFFATLAGIAFGLARAAHHRATCTDGYWWVEEGWSGPVPVWVCARSRR